MLLRNIVKQLGIGDEATVVIPVTVGFPVELVFVVFVLFKGGAQVDDFDPGVCDRFRDLFKAAGTLLRNVVCGHGFGICRCGRRYDHIYYLAVRQIAFQFFGTRFQAVCQCFELVVVICIVSEIVVQ